MGVLDVMDRNKMRALKEIREESEILEYTWAYFNPTITIAAKKEQTKNKIYQYRAYLRSSFNKLCKVPNTT